MKNYLEVYIDELADINPCTQEETEALLNRLAGGDTDAAKRLIVGYLHIPAEAAAGFEDCGVPTADIIGEGNLALSCAVYETNAVTAQDFEQEIKHAVYEAINALLEEEGSNQVAAAKLEEEANKLLEITKDFEEEYDRPATLPELAKLMKLSEDEVEQILRVSYNAMKIGDQE